MLLTGLVLHAAQPGRGRGQQAGYVAVGRAQAGAQATDARAQRRHTRAHAAQARWLTLLRSRRGRGQQAGHVAVGRAQASAQAADVAVGRTQASAQRETPVLTLTRREASADAAQPGADEERPVLTLLSPVEVEVDRLVTLLFVVLRPVLQAADIAVGRRAGAQRRPCSAKRRRC